MAYRRSSSMYDAMMSGLTGLGGVATAITDSRKQASDLKLAASQLAESGQNQTLNQQKIDANKETMAQALARKQLVGSMEDRGALTDKAMEGAPTADGTAVDFAAVKSARNFDQDAKAWNSFHSGDPDFVPMSGEKLRKMAETKSVAANQADQADILKGERDAETHVSKMASEKAMRESGRFSFVPGEGGAILRGNTKTGDLEDTGKKGAPKPGEKNAEFNALPVEAQEQIKKISQSMGFQKTLKGSVASDLEQFKAAKTPDAALSYGLGMLKALNSTLGPDALSNDESERLGAELKAQVGNWSGPGKFIGRDLAAFVDKVQAKVNSLDGSIKRSEADIDKLYGRTPAAAPQAGAIDKVTLAQQALNDPEATEAEKAAARRILGK